jgi:hypothetical protein
VPRIAPRCNAYNMEGAAARQIFHRLLQNQKYV